MDRFGTGPDGHIDHARFADALLADRFEGAPAANWVPRFTGGETYEHRLSVREFRRLLEEKLVNSAGEHPNPNPNPNPNPILTLTLP